MGCVAVAALRGGFTVTKPPVCTSLDHFRKSWSVRVELLPSQRVIGPIKPGKYTREISHPWTASCILPDGGGTASAPGTDEYNALEVLAELAGVTIATNNNKV